MDRKKILFILAVIPFVVECIAMLFLPEQVALHYDSQFQVNGYGSKYMLLFTGVMTLIFGSFVSTIYQANEKTENESIVFYMGILALIICYVVNAFGLYGAFFFG